MYLEKEEMKFAALYAIKRYKAPLAQSRMYEIFTWDQEIMEYFDLADILAELLEDKYIIQKYYRNEAALCLTESGEEACRFFENRIPFSIRQRIDSAIGERKYDELVDPNAVKAEVFPGENGEYTAKCSILREKVPIFELSLSMGKYSEAHRVAENFKDSAYDIYEGVLELCAKRRK